MPVPRKDPFIKDLVKDLLNKDPFQRPLWEDVKQHRYFHDIDWEKAKKKELDVPYKPNAQKYQDLMKNNYPNISSLDPNGARVAYQPQKTAAYSPNTHKKKKPLLGDFTLYKVNKEFEHF